MKRLAHIFNLKTVFATLALALISAVGLSLIQTASVSASCNPNDIMPCGFGNSKSTFKTKYLANTTQKDLDEIYDDKFDPKFGGMSPSELDRFMNTAVWATVYKNSGKIVLDDGRVVATKAESMGRLKGSHRYSVSINGKTYFWDSVDRSFRSNSIRALVMMDKDNKYMEFAVLDMCGNPVTGEKPKFECKKLNSQPKEGTTDTYIFWTNVDLKNATIKNLHYDFGDGTTKDTNNKDLKIEHQFKPGKWHITVVVTYVVNGVEQKEELQINCQTDIEVKEKTQPDISCTDLTKSFVADRKYKFTGHATFKDADLTKATFDFDDGTTAPGDINKSTNSATITAEHTYAEDIIDTKTITLTLEFKVKGDSEEVKSDSCEVQISGEVLPEEIVRTGPAEIIGGALGFGSLAGAGMYYRASRQKLHNLIKK